MYQLIRMNSSSSTEHRQKLIQYKQKKLVQTRDTILELNDDILKVSDKLEEKKLSDKSVYVAKSRIVTHNKANELDNTKRPSDRGKI